MPANVNPIFTLTPNVGFTVIGAQNTKSDGSGTIGTDLWKCFLSDATNGSYVGRIRFNPTSSVAGTSTAATVLRIFLSSVSSGVTTTGNTMLWQEQAVGIQVADSSSIGTFFFEISLGFALPAGWSILCSTHIANASNTAWVATVLGGNY